MDSLEEMDKFLETCSLISKPQVLIQAEISPSIPWPLPPFSSSHAPVWKWPRKSGDQRAFPSPAPAPLLLPNAVSGPSGAGGEKERKEALTWLLLARWPSMGQIRMILWLLEILSLVLLSTPSLAKVTHPDWLITPTFSHHPRQPSAHLIVPRRGVNPAMMICHGFPICSLPLLASPLAILSQATQTSFSPLSFSKPEPSNSPCISPNIRRHPQILPRAL